MRGALSLLSTPAELDKPLTLGSEDPEDKSVTVMARRVRVHQAGSDSMATACNRLHNRQGRGWRLSEVVCGAEAAGDTRGHERRKRELKLRSARADPLLSPYP